MDYMRLDGASLLMTEDCNLNCDYCYEKGQHIAKIMTLDVAKKAVEFLISGAKHNKSDSIYIYFFGGEPLLNFPVMDATFDYAVARTKEEGLKFDCKLITNCTVWPKGYDDFLRKWYKTIGTIYVQLSIDGMPSIQDLHRVTAAGKKSSPLVEKTLKKYADIAQELGLTFGREIQVHSVYTKETLSSIYDSYLYFRSLGFPGYVGMPVIEDEWSDEDVKIYEEQLTKISDKLVGDCQKEKTDKYFAFMNILSKCNTQLPDRACGAGFKFCSISPTGEIYPCHRFYFNSKEDFYLGNLDSDYTELDDKRDIFLQIKFKHMLGDRQCGDCGNTQCRACFATNYEYSKNIAFTPPAYCKIARVESDVAAKTRSKMEAAGLFRSGNGNSCQCGNHGNNDQVHQDILELSQNLRDAIAPLNDFIATMYDQTKENQARIELLSSKVDTMLAVIGSLVDMLQKVVVK